MRSTSAPRSTSSRVHIGPARTCEKSKTRMPASGRPSDFSIATILVLIARLFPCGLPRLRGGADPGEITVAVDAQQLVPGNRVQDKRIDAHQVQLPDVARQNSAAFFLGQVEARDGLGGIPL